MLLHFHDNIAHKQLLYGNLLCKYNYVWLKCTSIEKVHKEEVKSNKRIKGYEIFITISQTWTTFNFKTFYLVFKYHQLILKVFYWAKREYRMYFSFIYYLTSSYINNKSLCITWNCTHTYLFNSYSILFW